MTAHNMTSSDIFQNYEISSRVKCLSYISLMVILLLLGYSF